MRLTSTVMEREIIPVCTASQSVQNMLKQLLFSSSSSKGINRMSYGAPESDLQRTEMVELNAPWLWGSQDPESAHDADEIGDESDDGCGSGDCSGS